VGVESAPLEQAGRETQRHRRVVRPLAGRQVERAAADHVDERLELAAPPELERGAEGIADREPEQTSAEALERAEAR